MNKFIQKYKVYFWFNTILHKVDLGQIRKKVFILIVSRDLKI